MSSIEDMSVEGERYYWERVASKVLDSYGTPLEDEQVRDLGGRIRDAVEACGKEDMERMQQTLNPDLPVWRGVHP